MALTSIYITSFLQTLIPSYFKPYGSEIDVICDEEGTWNWLEINSINYDKTTFKYRVYRCPYPYISVEWLEPPVTLYHAKLAVGRPLPALLWLTGLDPAGLRYFMNVPKFVSNVGQTALLATEEETAHAAKLFAYPHAVIEEVNGFTSRAPKGARVGQHNPVLAYRRWQINRIAKRHNI